MDDLYIKDEYPRRGSKKFFKPILKEEKKENPVLVKWLESRKHDIWLFSRNCIFGYFMRLWDSLHWKESEALAGLVDHLGNKADLTPSLLKDQAATGADWREKLTMLLAVMVLLWPSRLQSLAWYPVEAIATPFDGAERNRTAVRDTGVNHLVY